MFKYFCALIVATAVVCSAAYAQTRTIYHWRSFDERASVWSGEYAMVVEKYGPLIPTEGWPIQTALWFDFYTLGVRGQCWLAPEAVSFDRVSGKVRLQATVTSGECDWLDGVTSVRLEVTWTPDGSYHSLRHYTLLGDINETSSEQGWTESWRNAEVEGAVWTDGSAVPTPIPQDQFGFTERGWGHGVIPMLGSLASGVK